MGIIKNGNVQSGHGTLNIDCTEESTDTKTDFLNAGKNSGRLKDASMIIEWTESTYEVS